MVDKSLGRITLNDLETLPPLDPQPGYMLRFKDTKQLGRATPYISRDGTFFTSCVRPAYQQLAAWDSASRKEPIISQGLEILATSVQSKLGLYTHEKLEIADFIRANIEPNITRWLSMITRGLCKFGFVVCEIIYKKVVNRKGVSQIWIDDLIPYHPTEVLFKLNKHNRLTHGERLENDPYLTGIWVPAPNDLINKRRIDNSFTGSHVRLKERSVFYIARQPEGNNPYGTSLLESVYSHHIYKELYRDMQATALDRYGSPLIYALVPAGSTIEQVEGVDGNTRNLSLIELVEQKLSNIGSQSVIILPKNLNGESIELNTLTTGNNFSDAFIKAIDDCDDNMLQGMGIPNLMTKDKNNGLGSSGSAERQVDTFQAKITQLYKQITDELINQVIYSLILWNFDSDVLPEARNKGNFTTRVTLYAEVDSYTKLLKVLLDGEIIDSKYKDVILDMFRLPKIS
jgi:hypothetical protein